MKVVIFGATGMVGQSALRECLLDNEVQEILTIGRKRTNQQHKKLKEIELENIADLSSIEHEITGFDACFFCLGVSSAGMKEKEYRKITYDITLSVAETLARLNLQMTFIYVSGSGTDSSEKGRSIPRQNGCRPHHIRQELAQARHPAAVSAVLLVDRYLSDCLVNRDRRFLYAWLLP